MKLTDEMIKELNKKVEENVDKIMSDFFKEYNENNEKEKEVDAKKEVSNEKEEEVYHFKKEGDKLICTDEGCSLSGVEVYTGRNAKDLIGNLANIYHKETHDPFTCTKCSKDLNDMLKQIGYDVQNKDGKIVLNKKK